MHASIHTYIHTYMHSYVNKTDWSLYDDTNIRKCVKYMSLVPFLEVDLDLVVPGQAGPGQVVPGLVGLALLLGQVVAAVVPHDDVLGLELGHLEVGYESPDEVYPNASRR